MNIYRDDVNAILAGGQGWLGEPRDTAFSTGSSHIRRAISTTCRRWRYRRNEVFKAITLDRQGKDWAVVNSKPVAGSSHTGGMGGPNDSDAGGGSPPAGHAPTN